MLARNQLEGIKATINMNSVVKYAHFYLNGEKRGGKTVQECKVSFLYLYFMVFVFTRTKTFCFCFFYKSFP